MYKPYIHVERLGKEDTDGILNGTIHVTPKLDGTNAVVYYENGQVCGGARKRELTIEDDNAGFVAWLRSGFKEATLLKMFIEENPQLILYGEWGVGRVGSIKDYDKEAQDILWLFDCFSIDKKCYLPDEQWRPLVEEAGLKDFCVPIILTKTNPTEEEIVEAGKECKFLLSNANHSGEGVVIRNPSFRDKYGHYKVAKIVFDEYKQKKSKPKHKVGVEDVELAIVDTYVTDAELSKAKAKTALFFNTLEFETSSKQIGYYLNLVWCDLLSDEMVNICKKFKNPTINFRKLRELVQERAKTYIAI